MGQKGTDDSSINKNIVYLLLNHTGGLYGN